MYIDFDENDEQIEKDQPIENIILNLEFACKIKERAATDDVQFLLNEIVPETQTQKCFMACWMERFGIVILTICFINNT